MWRHCFNKMNTRNKVDLWGDHLPHTYDSQFQLFLWIFLFYTLVWEYKEFEYKSFKLKNESILDSFILLGNSGKYILFRTMSNNMDDTVDGLMSGVILSLGKIFITSEGNKFAFLNPVKRGKMNMDGIPNLRRIEKFTRWIAFELFESTGEIRRSPG